MKKMHYKYFALTHDKKKQVHANERLVIRSRQSRRLSRDVYKLFHTSRQDKEDSVLLNKMSIELSL
jgi:hypothetical protein